MYILYTYDIHMLHILCTHDVYMISTHCTYTLHAGTRLLPALTHWNGGLSCLPLHPDLQLCTPTETQTEAFSTDPWYCAPVFLVIQSRSWTPENPRHQPHGCVMGGPVDTETALVFWFTESPRTMVSAPHPCMKSFPRAPVWTSGPGAA